MIGVLVSGLLSHLTPGGRMIIGDIVFPNLAAMERLRGNAGGEWDEEFYWLANESLTALQKVGINAEYTQVSSCAGVFYFFIPK